jgi:hypothetical protein
MTKLTTEEEGFRFLTERGANDGNKGGRNRPVILMKNGILRKLFLIISFLRQK